MNLDLSDGFLEVVLGITAVSVFAAICLICYALWEALRYSQSQNHLSPTGVALRDKPRGEVASAKNPDGPGKNPG
jgi:hypothetical protein